MNNEEKILQLLGAMQTDISGMKTDINGMQTDISGMKTDMSGMQTDINGMKTDICILKETQAEHTTALNALLEWADECREAYRFPLPKLM